MGLRQCFTAQDAAAYRQATDPSVCESPAYNGYLTTSPRIYAEEIWSGHNGPPFIGALWADKWPAGVENPYSATRINLFGLVEQICHPSWGMRRWKFDGATGILISSATEASGDTVSTDPIVADPQGNIWRYSGLTAADFDGAVRLDPETGEPDAGDVILHAAFGHTEWQDFNVDRANNRLFARDIADNEGLISIFNYSTQALIAEIYTPNATDGIVLTHDGFIYVVDALGWIVCYDYDGVFQSAFRNPQASAPPAGHVYGWDPNYKRLLYMAGTDPAADGASTLVIEGFYPTPEAEILTPPIPRKVPRKNRAITFFSRMCGVGAEPLAGRRATITGDVTLTTATDREGDVIIPATPSASGAFDVEIEVEE